ncbi:1-phosphofructokinase family hexose kinase [Tautonia plasticadhaerens]|uniref:Tagatose-6-phosphate kinase n=1 Tax=Tautonia plasticadhaerens TaxID=2527974 RepID=A0A518H7H4_9BACT|nr:PfkB family carbohydrate kinase [Tautonia plasticadhaerens]QDV36792.1 Tagatose-6-phosphate kinase [Tautonia plasticadhaerens]
MILCVTLNPCLDKTLTVPPWKPGQSVRGQAVSEVVGGKGNNVARALKRLGKEARPATFFGGPVGEHCAALLREREGFDPLVVPTEAPTRTILTVRAEGEPGQTAFFDPDPAISSQEAEVMLRGVEAAIATGRVEAVTLSGSSPSEATDGLYLDLISMARMRRLPVFLDTYGAPLENIWGFWPDVIQLNRSELARHLRRDDPTDEQIFELLGTWNRHGVRLAIVTDGPDAALVQSEGRFFRAYPPEIEVVNPIGSGDSMLAGLVDSWLSGVEAEPMIRRAIACGAANALVWEAGQIDPDVVSRIEGEVELEPVEDQGEVQPERPGDSQGFLRVGVYGRATSRFGRR